MAMQWRRKLTGNLSVIVKEIHNTSMKTRDKILAAALTLFNEQGEHKVSTNHVAAHLGMSPGNLYYHFKNKQAIIFELFLAHEAQIEAALSLVSSHQKVSLEEKCLVMSGVFQSLWD